MLFFLQNFDAIQFAAFIVVAFFAFAYHEFGHAIVADYLGDPTPRAHGRITLNPFPHISPVGIIMLILIGFGWAVTPINPSYMRGNPRTSHAIVAISGPAMNLVMAILFAIPYRLLIATGLSPLATLPDVAIQFIMSLLFWGVFLNLFLIGFNLLPIPPLDGFWILRGLLPPEMSYQLDGLQRYGVLIFIAVIFVLPRIGLDVVGAVASFSQSVLGILVGI